MNRFVSKIVFVFLFGSYISLFAECENSLQIRGAAFFPSSERYREIYSKVGGSLQVEYANRFQRFVEGWANLDWTYRRGRSIGFHQNTTVNILACSIGFKLIFPCGCFAPYLGIGPSIAGVWLQNNTDLSDREVSKAAYGGLAKVGFYLFLNERVFLDVFVDYLYIRANFQKHINVGGVKAGAGIGYRF